MTSAAEIVAADGTRLAGIVYEAAVPARGVALIVAAMAVKHQFYAALAAWLVAHGWDVVTFDYRGMGDRAPASLKGFKADVLTWARQALPPPSPLHASAPTAGH